MQSCGAFARRNLRSAFTSDVRPPVLWREGIAGPRNDPYSQAKSAEGRILCVSQQRLAALGATLSAGPGTALAVFYFTVRSRDMPRVLWPWTGQYTL
jgi:hypothetical protein